MIISEDVIRFLKHMIRLHLSLSSDLQLGSSDDEQDYFDGIFFS